MAKKVVAWLGTEQEGSQIAIAFIKETVGPKKGRLLHNICLRGGCESGLQAVVNLTMREYWKRIRIIQEIVRACEATIHCGF
jgi:hypothetical protein